MLGHGAAHGTPRVCSVRHVHRKEHECEYHPGTAAARLKKFDHRGVGVRGNEAADKLANMWVQR